MNTVALIVAGLLAVDPFTAHPQEIKLGTHAESIAFVPGSSQLVVRTAKSIVVVDSNTLAQESLLRWETSDSTVTEDGSHAIAMGPTGDTFAIARGFGFVQFRRKQSEPNGIHWELSHEDNAGDYFCRGLAISPNGKMLGAGYRRPLFDSRVSTPKARTHSLWENVSGHWQFRAGLDWRESFSGYCVCFSSDSKFVAFGGSHVHDLVESGTQKYESGELRIYDAESGKLLKSITNLQGRVVAAVFQPSSHLLALGSSNQGQLKGDVSDTVISLYDITKNRTSDLRTNAKEVHGIAFSGDGKCLFAATDRGVMQWQTKDWERGLVLPGSDRRTMKCLDVTADGKTVAAVDVEGRMSIWQANHN